METERNKKMETEATNSHLLKREWSLWYFERESGKSWEQCFHDVAACKSIEEFWILFNSIKLPTEIDEGCNYALFESSVRPMWEDERNQNGGRWIITLEKRVDCDEVNRLWLDTLLILIEEQMSGASSICGVIFHNRWRFMRICMKEKKRYLENMFFICDLFYFAAIWVSTSRAHEFFQRELRSRLRLADSVPCVFENH